MGDIVLVTGMQEGYLDERTRPLATDIKAFLERPDVTPVFARFVNQEDSNFVDALEWREMFEPEETTIVDELGGYANKSNTFDHHTYSALTADGIQSFLDERDTDNLYICGVDTDATVLDTAYHAFNTGRSVGVIRDLCDSRGGEELHRYALQIMERTIGRVVYSEDIL